MDKKDFSKQLARNYNPDYTPKPAVGGARLADKLIREALESQIPLAKNQELFKLITQSGNSLDMPDRLLEAVTELINFIERMDAGYSMDAHNFGAGNA